MAPIGKIYGYNDHAKVSRTLAAAKINGLELEVVNTEAMKGDTRKPEYAAKFPMSKIPAFEGADGFKLIEGRAIARYVAGLSDNAKLLGTDEKSAAQVEQWIDFADEEIFNHAVALFFIFIGRIPYSKPAETLYWDNLSRSLKFLDDHLLKSTFVVGHRLTLADLTLAGNIKMLFGRLAGPEIRNKYPNVLRYAETIWNQPNLAEIYGKVELAAENAKYVPPKKEEKPKAAAAPKAEKPKAAPKEAEDPAEPAPVKAAPHPCASLPASKFVLDEAKRQYSNLDTPDFLKWFYPYWTENCQPGDFTIHKLTYKYNDELTQVFMSSNLIGGLFARLEASRKYVLGNMGVLGESNNSVIAGAFIVRGTDADAIFNVAPDYESYSAEPLDLSKPEDKKFFEDAFLWELKIDGKEWADGKTMK